MLIPEFNPNNVLIYYRIERLQSELQQVQQYEAANLL